MWDIAVDARATRQAFQGFGTSLAWWAVVVGALPDAIRSRVLDLVFSRDKGLGFQVARYNIGGSGWASPDAPNLRPGGNVPSYLAPDGKTYDWAQDAAQVWVLLAARDRGARTFEAFSNSPPYWMTRSGRASGGPDPKADNLAPANYTAFAGYLARVVRHFGDEHGLRFTTVDPFNEPSTDYWRAGNVQEGCHFERGSQWAFLPVLAKALKAAGAGGVALAASDETNIADATKTFKAMTPAALKLVTQVSGGERGKRKKREGRASCFFFQPRMSARAPRVASLSLSVPPATHTPLSFLSLSLSLSLSPPPPRSTPTPTGAPPTPAPTWAPRARPPRASACG